MWKTLKQKVGINKITLVQIR